MDEHFEIALSARFDEGQLVISRQDGKPITIITHEETDGECVEILEIGASGNAVKALQALLNCHGQHLDVDGIFGSLTQTALIIFQDAKSIPATGTCDRVTWEKLIGR